MFITQEYIYLHLLIILFSSYNYTVAKYNFKIYNTLHKLFTKKDELFEFVSLMFKIIFIEELCFRVYLNEILDYFVVYHNSTQFISSICFSLSHIINYFLARNLKLQNIRMSIAQFIYSFILSFYFLQNTTPLGSLIIHQYSNMFCILIQYCFHNNYCF